MSARAEIVLFFFFIDGVFVVSHACIVLASPGVPISSFLGHGRHGIGTQSVLFFLSALSWDGSLLTSPWVMVRGTDEACIDKRGCKMEARVACTMPRCGRMK